MTDELEQLTRRKAEMTKANALIRERTTRRWIAEQLGVSYGYLNQVAYGHAAISPALKAKIAGFLGMPVGDVFPSGDARV